MKTVRTRGDLQRAVAALGVLPFFANRVAGWSLEEHVDPAVWFTSREGPWEWKGQMASERRCVYGKFILNKAAFVSPEAFADLLNLRRGGMTFEERLEDGQIPWGDARLMAYLRAHPNVLSKHAKLECGLAKGYDAALTRLQMAADVILCDFRYSISRAGEPYGWGNAALDLPERWFGEGAFAVPEDRAPEESLGRLAARILSAVPGLDEDALRRALEKA